MDLVVNIVEKKYGKNLVFDNCSLEFHSNLVKIDGKKGSGKSTLLKILSGETKFKGEIYLENELIKFSDLQKTFVMVDQKIKPFEEKTVLYYIDSKKDKEIDDSIINEFGFSDKLNQKVSELSEVWKKKLTILLAFISNPKVLLLDEYTNGLDKEFIEKVDNHIKLFSKEHMVIYIAYNHNIYEEKINISSFNNDNNLEKSNNLKENKMELNSKYKEKFFSIFKILSIVLMIIFSSFIVTACNFNNLSVSQDDLWIEFLLDNNLNYIQVDNSFDEDTTYSPFYETDIDGVYEENDVTDKISYMTYTDSLDLPLESEASIPEDEDIDEICYVTSTYADLLGTTFVLTPEIYYDSLPLSTTSSSYDDSITYFVKGVLDINVNNYYNDYLNSIFVVGTTDSYDNEFVYATDDEIEEELDFVTSARCIDFSMTNAIDNFNIYTIGIVFISIVILLVICVAYFIKVIDDNKENFSLTNYKLFATEFRAKRLIYYFVTGFLIIIFSFLLGLLEYNFLMNKEYSLTIDIYDFNIDIAFLIGVIYIILFIVFDFILINNRNDYKLTKSDQKN